MKNKFIYLSMAMISAFSLASCNSFERKVDADTGKEIVAKANVASQEHIDNITKQDFFSLDLVGELKGKANLDLSYKKTTEEATQDSLKSNIEYDLSFEYKGNHNAKNIKSNPVVLSDTNAYLSLNYNTNVDEIINKGLIKISQNGTDLNVYNQHLEEAPTKKPYRLTDKEVEEYSKAFTYILEDLSFEEIIKECILDIDDIDYQRIKLQYLKFQNGQVDAQEFIDYIDLYVFSNELFLHTPEGTYETCVKLLENINELSPLSFFDYTTVSNKTSTIVNAKLDYKEWGKSVNDTLSKIINELKEEHSSFEMISSIKKNLIDDLPDEFSLGYSLTFDENNIISNITYDMIAIGSLENVLTSLSKLFPELTNAIIKYDIELSYNLTFAFKEEAIEIPTI